MKVLVVGAAGKQGAGVATCMAETERVSTVVVADIDIEGARRVAHQIGDKAKAAWLDAEDRGSVLKLMRGTDMVMNMVGPGFRYAPTLLQAALESRVNYVDIQDDGEAISRLLAFDRAAKEAGLTMITGVGLTPGVSNLLARYGADKLDRVEDIRIAWVANVTLAPTAANWAHRLGMYAMDVPVFDGGRATRVRGGTGEERVDWPQPVGSVVERFSAHTEPLTLPRYINKGIKHVSVKGAFTPQEHDDLVAHFASLAFGSMRPIKIGGASIAPLDFVSNFFVSDEFKGTNFYKDLMDREKAIGENIGLRIEVNGWKNDKLTGLLYTVFSTTDRNPWIYTPACIVARMVLAGRIRLKGVVCPEALDPKPILHELAKSGLTYKETIC